LAKRTDKEGARDASRGNQGTDEPSKHARDVTDHGQDSIQGSILQELTIVVVSIESFLDRKDLRLREFAGSRSERTDSGREQGLI